MPVNPQCNFASGSVVCPSDNGKTRYMHQPETIHVSFPLFAVWEFCKVLEVEHLCRLRAVFFLDVRILRNAILSQEVVAPAVSASLHFKQLIWVPSVHCD